MVPAACIFLPNERAITTSNQAHPFRSGLLAELLEPQSDHSDYGVNLTPK